MGWVIKSESDAERVWAEVGDGGAETGVYSVETLAGSAPKWSQRVEHQSPPPRLAPTFSGPVERHDRPPIEVTSPRRFMAACAIATAISAGMTVGIVELLRFVL